MTANRAYFRLGLFILLASAVASSFGGPSGLLWGPSVMRAGRAAAQPFQIRRSLAWIAVGLLAFLSEALILGPTLRF